MKKLVVSLFFVFLVAQNFILFAQKEFSYQAVLRDGRGYTRPNEKVDVFVRLYSGEMDQMVYEEKFLNIFTDALGFLTIEVGTGRAEKNKFTQLDFSKPLWIEVFLNQESVGKVPYTPVPRANYAYESSSLDGLTRKEFMHLLALKADSAHTHTALVGGAETDPIYRKSVAARITENDMHKWNGKSNFSGEYADLRGVPAVFDSNYSVLKNVPAVF
ncbi:MAG: hypothetical protein RSC04_05940, partial [Bacteroidales bacterium]